MIYQVTVILPDGSALAKDYNAPSEEGAIIAAKIEFVLTLSGEYVVDDDQVEAIVDSLHWSAEQVDDAPYVSVLDRLTNCVKGPGNPAWN